MRLPYEVSEAIGPGRCREHPEGAITRRGKVELRPTRCLNRMAAMYRRLHTPCTQLAPAPAPKARTGLAAFRPGILLMALMVAPTPVLGQESTLNVNGVGSVDVAPDRARLVLAVETEAGTAREAGQENAARMERVMAALRGAGVPNLRIETSGYSLSPRYATQRVSEPQQIVGYTARNQIRVVVDDPEVLGGLIDRALEAGANRVASLNFEVRDPDPHRREALARAIAQARLEAEAMASALGMRLGDPISVQGGAEVPSPRFESQRFELALAYDAGAPTPVEAGVQTIQARVSIQYRLHPGPQP